LSLAWVWFVEARPVGTEQWTTLPDANGHTTRATGDSCFEDGGWWQLHERLQSYPDRQPRHCTPTGTSGEWNAATGNSSGWQDWEIDISRYAGQKVEIAIVAATDWAVGGLGAWVDGAEITINGAQQSQTSFETDTGLADRRRCAGLDAQPPRRSVLVPPSSTWGCCRSRHLGGCCRSRHLGVLP
jgi:hypothetical protein